MKKTGMLILAVVLAHSASAHAEQWSKTYSLSGTPDLRVETSDANIHVDTWDQNKIEATIVSSHYKFGPGGLTVEERQSGDMVEINLRFPRHVVNFNVSNHRVDITIHMPREGRVKLHTGDGKVELADFKGDMDVDSGDGAEEIHHVEGKLYARTGDGHINADGRFDALNLKSGDGRVDARASVGSTLAEEWMLHTGDGSVSLELPENLSADLYLHTGDGHIDVNLPMTTEGRIKESEVRGKLNGGGKLITVQTGDGSINVRKG
jgi:DUF4097 and DUF4098 domain-containing protein YvlB